MLVLVLGDDGHSVELRPPRLRSSTPPKATAIRHAQRLDGEARFGVFLTVPSCEV